MASHRCEAAPPELSIWHDAVLAYASDRCGVKFTRIEEADAWLTAHPGDPLNRKAIREAFREP